MAISSITYANRMNLDLGYDRLVGGLMSYKENAYDRMWVFSNGWTKAINCVRPYGDTNWYTDELMQLNNGLKLCFMYQFTAQDAEFINCTLKCKYVLKNSSGTIVEDYGDGIRRIYVFGDTDHFDYDGDDFEIIDQFSFEKGTVMEREN